MKQIKVLTLISILFCAQPSHPGFSQFKSIDNKKISLLAAATGAVIVAGISAVSTVSILKWMGWDKNTIASDVTSLQEQIKALPSIKTELAEIRNSLTDSLTESNPLIDVASEIRHLKQDFTTTIAAQILALQTETTSLRRMYADLTDNTTHRTDALNDIVNEYSMTLSQHENRLASLYESFIEIGKRINIESPIAASSTAAVASHDHPVSTLSPDDAIPLAEEHEKSGSGSSSNSSDSDNSEEEELAASQASLEKLNGDPSSSMQPSQGRTSKPVDLRVLPRSDAYEFSSEFGHFLTAPSNDNDDNRSRLSRSTADDFYTYPHSSSVAATSDSDEEDDAAIATTSKRNRAQSAPSTPTILSPRSDHAGIPGTVAGRRRK